MTNTDPTPSTSAAAAPNIPSSTPANPATSSGAGAQQNNVEDKFKRPDTKISAFNSYQQQRSANNDDSLRQLSELLLLLEEYPPLVTL
jgi:hypothetical protein